MTPENSSALPTFARTASEAFPQTTSDATANEAGLRDAPGSSRGSSGWSLNEPTDGAVHGVPADGPARHRSTTSRATFPGTRRPTAGCPGRDGCVLGNPGPPPRLGGPARRRDGSGPSPGTPRTAGSRPTSRPAPARRSPGSKGGRLNVAYNCVDRHVAAGRGDKVALHFEGEPGDRRTVTYAELQREVSKAANALLELGITKGDRVVIYLPVIPETVIITLAVARIGAIHSLVFGGFSAEALKFRVEDTGAKLLVTTDGQFRRGTAVPVKDNADAAVSGDNAIEHVLVVNRTTHADELDTVPMTAGRDVWWHDAVGTASEVHEAGGVRRRDAAVHHVHLRHHRQAQGPGPHLRRLPDPGVLELRAPVQQPGPRAAGRGRALVHGRPRLGHRAHLRDLRPALQRRHAGDLRGHAEHPAPGPALRDHRTLRGHAVLHRAHPGPLPDGLVPGRRPGRRTTSPPSGCSAPWARPSTPRPGAGCGTNDRRRHRPRGGHLVAVRNRRHRPLPARRRTPPSSPAARPAPLPGVGTRTSWTTAGNRCRPAPGLHCGRPSPGPSIARTVWGNPRALLRLLLAPVRGAGLVPRRRRRQV